MERPKTNRQDVKMIKPKKCIICKEPFVPRNSIIKVCDTHAYQYAKSLLKKKEDKEWREKKKALKEKLKTLTEYEKDARKVYQKWIRMRDEKRPCISCNATQAKQWDGGHYYKAELYSGLIFDERNCHKQCSRCNDLYSGMQLEYRAGLIERYGKEFVEQLESEANSKRDYKYTKQELIDIKNKYSEKVKQLET